VLKKYDYDKAFIEQVRKMADKCAERWKEYYPFHSSWFTHVKSILKYIIKFQKGTDFRLSKKENTVLIAAAILHDIGKILPCLHPSIPERDTRDPMLISGKLEEAHHILTFLLLRYIFNEMLRQMLLDNKAEIRPLNIDLGDDANKEFIRLALASARNPEYIGYLRCVAWISLRHKKMTDTLFGEFKDELHEEFTSEADIVSMKNIRNNTDIKRINNWLGGDENHDNNTEASITRFEILSALFQLGDKLDISKSRINENRFFLAVLVDDIGLPHKQKELPHPDAMARWYQFWYTEEPELGKEKESHHNDSAKDSSFSKSFAPGLKVTIPYMYPECLKDDFPLFRYQAEKDFEDLEILFVLQNALRKEKKDENYRVTIKRTENKPKGGSVKDLPIRIRGLKQRNERLLYCHQKVCQAGRDDEEYRDFVEESLERYLEIPTNVLSERKAFQCKSETPGDEPWKKCLLMYLVEKAFNRNNEQASYREWQEMTVRKIENVRHILCNYSKNPPKDKMTPDEKSMARYLEEIKKENVMLGLSDRAIKGVENWKEKIEMERNTFSPDALFYRGGPSRYIPISMDVAYLLNQFRHLLGESLSIEHIADISGLDRGRILLYCEKLEHEGFLLLDSQYETYKLNTQKRTEVENALKHFDYRHAELVSKVRDIKRFGKPLALCADHNETKLVTRINGLDKILAPHDKELRGLPLRKSILLLGPPGAGKTTLALEIVRQVRMKGLPGETALFLTFEEDIKRLMETYESFGWTHSEMEFCVRSLRAMSFFSRDAKSTRISRFFKKMMHPRRSLSTLNRRAYLNNPEEFLTHFLNILDEFAPDLVVVDNLGYFLQLVPAEISREVLNRLIRVFVVRGITSLLVGENIPDSLGFEAYDVDGVIYLGKKDGRRWLEISKLRGREFASGKHPFIISDTRKTKRREDPVIQVFPNIQMHIDIDQRNKEKGRPEAEAENDKYKVLSSGVEGLDELLPIFPVERGKESGFQKGEAILVLGSPGAGKTLLGLHFLKKGYIPKESDDEKRERVLWVSFESDLKGLYLATRSFRPGAGFSDLINDMDNEEKEKAKFRFYPPAQLEPDELVNFLLEECEKGVKRLVLDSVTDLEQVFPTDIEFKAFMTSLVQLLRQKEVTAMFLYRSKGFFGKTEDIGRVLASVVDTIVCLKVLEIQNAMQKGIFLLKVRGREHRSKLLSIDFKEDEGIIVTDRGWTMSGLISGEAGEIREPRVSVKLFFENRNERLINSLIVKEYNRRFEGGQTSFVHVRKPQIYSEFWSFRGSSGAGHANVRVVSLCDYWAILFHRQGKLYNLWEYVSTGTRQIVWKEEFWRRCATYSHKDHAFKIFSIPNYVDVGILAFQKKIKNLKKFWTFVYQKKSPPSDRNAVKGELTRLTWNMLDPENNPDLKELVKNIESEFKNKKEIKDKENASGDNNKNKASSKNKDNVKADDELPPRYLFAMPSLFDTSTFVSFFLEVYWSFGGAVFDFRKVFNSYADNCWKKYINTNIQSDKIKKDTKESASQESEEQQPDDSDAADSAFWESEEEQLDDVDAEDSTSRESEEQQPDDSDAAESVSRESEELTLLYTFPYKTSGDNKSKMCFIAEILTLIPERILNFAIQRMNKEEPNLIGDICRYGEVMLQHRLDEKVLPHTVRELDSGIGDIKNPLAEFIKIYRINDKQECPINTFIHHLCEGLKKDNIWERQKELKSALKEVKSLVENILKTNDDEDERTDLLLILFSVVSRIITDRERYVFLLEWLYKPDPKTNEKIIELNEVINIREESPYAYRTLEFLFQLVNSGIAPNPHRGDFTHQSYLARKWSGDIAPEPKLPDLEKIIEPLALYAPTEAFELDEQDEIKRKADSKSGGIDSIDTGPFGIVPLPSYDRGEENNTKDCDDVNNSEADVPHVPAGKWSYTVLGLWSLGITSPAVSPEIGWIFIDALTEDKFVEMRARRGLGLPAKVSAYNRATICEAQPDIYGVFDEKGKLKEDEKGIVQFYQIATQDKPQSGSQENTENEGLHYRTRERASIPYYFKIEEILSKELGRFFEPSFFDILPASKTDRKEFIKKVLRRTNNRIRNFLDEAFKKRDTTT
jgi:circadian clock protein KaiC